MARIHFYKFYPNVLEVTGNLIQGNILMLILAKCNGKNKALLQQSYIARKLFLYEKTVRNNVKELTEKGYIKAKPSYYMNDNGVKLSSTLFEIMPKLKRLIIEDEQQTDRTPTPQTPTKEMTAKVEKAKDISTTFSNEDYELYMKLTKEMEKNFI